VRAEDVHGFNYDGSWGTSGLDLWQHHDHGRMAVEVARGKEHFPGWNVARWWLSHEGHQRDPARFLANFEAGLSVFAAHQILVVPVLFNRWRDPVCDFGGVPLDHILPHHSAWTGVDDLFAEPVAGDPVRSPVQALFHRYLVDVVESHAGDERIWAWDLCNEPLMGPYVEDDQSWVRAAELTWLTWVQRVCKDLGVQQPLTIGNFASVKALELTEPISDVLGFHPYFMANGSGHNANTLTNSAFEAFLDACEAVAERSGKPLYASETVWGARDDATHVEVMRYTLDQLTRRRIGFTVHALGHSLVADLHQDAYGPVGSPEWLHFVEADGTLRAGHEAFNEYAPVADPGGQPTS